MYSPALKACSWTCMSVFKQCSSLWTYSCILPCMFIHTYWITYNTELQTYRSTYIHAYHEHFNSKKIARITTFSEYQFQNLSHGTDRGMQVFQTESRAHALCWNKPGSLPRINRLCLSKAQKHFLCTTRAPYSLYSLLVIHLCQKGIALWWVEKLYTLDNHISSFCALCCASKNRKQAQWVMVWMSMPVRTWN
jgi:hypothetical protein